MENHLLEYIKIKDFKCFKDFEAKGFKRVNLIGGKNNVGKTAFMEACYINVHSSNIDNLTAAIVDISISRSKSNVTEQILKSLSSIGVEALPQLLLHALEKTSYYNSSSNNNSIQFKIVSINGQKEYLFIINNREVSVNSNLFSIFNLKNLSYIRFNDCYGLSSTDLKEIYGSIQKKDKEELLNKYINKFDTNILSFKILEDEPACKVIDRDAYQNINEFGDGLKHYISIICSLYACENGYLFIDEIDNGIHYTQLDRLWEIILTVSKEQNVQVFATTHSKECIESYARVSKKLEDEDIAFIELGRDKKNELKAMVYPYDWFEDEVSQNHELRGW